MLKHGPDLIKPVLSCHGFVTDHADLQDPTLDPTSAGRDFSLHGDCSYDRWLQNLQTASNRYPHRWAPWGNGSDPSAFDVSFLASLQETQRHFQDRLEIRRYSNLDYATRRGVGLV